MKELLREIAPRAGLGDGFLSEKIPTPIKTKLVLPPPLQTPPPPKTRNFMGVGVFQQKEPKLA